MKTNPAQVKQVNRAFERMQKAVVKFLNICAANGSLVQSLRVQPGGDGEPMRTSVRYRRT